MKILIGITTYNRPEMFKKLLESISSHKDSQEINLLVFNDGSDVDYDYKADMNVYECYCPENHGKKRYYQLVNSMFKEANKMSWDVFYMMPDDIELKYGFFIHSLRLWNHVKSIDKTAVCLSVGHDHDRIEKPNWTGFPPKVFDEVVLTNWNDLLFMCDRNFFELVPEIHVPESRWRKNPFLGSGTGQFISNFLFNNGWSMYHTKDSLVTFSGAIAGQPSKMQV